MSTPPEQTPAPPRLRSEQVDDVTHVTFPRQLSDGTCVRELYEFAAEFSDTDNAKLHVNLRDLPMVTSGMAGILIQIQKMFRHTGAQLVVTVADELMFMQFKAMRLDQLLQIYFDPDAAIAAFK